MTMGTMMTTKKNMMMSRMEVCVYGLLWHP